MTVDFWVFSVTLVVIMMIVMKAVCSEDDYGDETCHVCVALIGYDI